MIRNIRFILPALALVSTVTSSAMHAQFYETAAKKLHMGTMSVGATGQFSTILEQNPSPGIGFYTIGTGTTRYPTAVTNQQQYTTDSAGFLATFGLQPVKWAGIELNYGFTHYQERLNSTYAIAPTATQSLQVPTDQHEFTAAYMIHPKHVPFQPFIGIGGGYIDFTPSNASNQWREAGLLETGFDIKTHNPHLGFRLEGRSLYYRSPNYYQPALSTRSWRVTEQPTASVYYAF